MLNISQISCRIVAQTRIISHTNVMPTTMPPSLPRNWVGSGIEEINLPSTMKVWPLTVLSTEEAAYQTMLHPPPYHAHARRPRFRPESTRQLNHRETFELTEDFWTNLWESNFLNVVKHHLWVDVGLGWILTSTFHKGPSLLFFNFSVTSHFKKIAWGPWYFKSTQVIAKFTSF